MINTTDTSYSHRIRPSILVLLYITTCGLYFFYWYYTTNKKLYSHHHQPVAAFWRTVGLLVPLLNVYLLWVLFRDIKKYANSAGIHSLEFPGLLTIAFLVSSALYRLPSLFSFFGFFSVVPVLWAQNTLNHYWAKVQPGLPEKRRLSWIEIVVCLAGSALLIMAFIGAGLKPSVDNAKTATTEQHI